MNAGILPQTGRELQVSLHLLTKNDSAKWNKSHDASVNPGCEWRLNAGKAVSLDLAAFMPK